MARLAEDRAAAVGAGDGRGGRRRREGGGLRRGLQVAARGRRRGARRRRRRPGREGPARASRARWMGGELGNGPGTGGVGGLVGGGVSARRRTLFGGGESKF